MSELLKQAQELFANIDPSSYPMILFGISFIFGLIRKLKKLVKFSLLLIIIYGIYCFLKMNGLITTV